MHYQKKRSRWALCAALALSASFLGLQARAADESLGYHPINPTTLILDSGVVACEDGVY